MRVLLAIMGPYPMEYEGGNTRDDFIALAEATRSAEVCLYEIPDLVKTVGHTSEYNSEWGFKHRGLHAMRCNAAEQARDYDYMLLVENDVILQPDTLERLLFRDVDVVVPRHEFPMFPYIRCIYYQPVPPRGHEGLWPMEWCGYPATLFKMASFEGLAPMFVGGGEGMDYTHWHDFGIRSWMDASIEAVNLRLAGAHELMTMIPGSATQHRKLTPAGMGEYCDGILYEYEDRDLVDDVLVYHVGCQGCMYRVDFKPPSTYRNEALQLSHILEQRMAIAGAQSA